MPETVAIASDHAGFDLKQFLVEELTRRGFSALDLGTHDRSSVDYPDFADAVAAALGEGQAEHGVLICGTGIGMGIAANRHRHIRAAVCHDCTSARLARQHNNANVLAMGARLIGAEVARDVLATFLDAAYEGGRHDRRIAKVS